MTTLTLKTQEIKALISLTKRELKTVALTNTYQSKDIHIEGLNKMLKTLEVALGESENNYASK